MLYHVFTVIIMSQGLFSCVFLVAIINLICIFTFTDVIHVLNEELPLQDSEG